MLTLITAVCASVSVSSLHQRHLSRNYDRSSNELFSFPLSLFVNNWGNVCFQSLFGLRVWTRNSSVRMCSDSVLTSDRTHQRIWHKQWSFNIMATLCRFSSQINSVIACIYLPRCRWFYTVLFESNVKKTWQLIYEKNLTFASYARNLFYDYVIWEITREYILERNHTNANYVRNHLHKEVIWNITLKYILGTNHTTVRFAQNHSFIAVL